MKGAQGGLASVQAPDGRCQVVSIKAVLRGLGWGMAGGQCEL